MGRRREYIGTVIGDKMQKTRLVRTIRLTKHAKYQKVIKRYNIFKVHDEENQAHVGDQVKIVETRPLSKDKRYRISEVIKKAAVIHTVEGDEVAVS